MQELMGRVTALDASVSQSLKVISYFDALVAGGVNLETLVRGAAALTGTVAGLDAPGALLRVDNSGRRLDIAATQTLDGNWPRVEVDSAARVWLERDGDAHANDSMVLERLALAVGTVRTRRLITPDEPVIVALDASRPATERASAATRLALPGGRLRVVATAPDLTPPGPSALIATPHGVVRATIVQLEARVTRGGMGRLTDAPDLPISWSTALLAYRLVDAVSPVVDADEIGVLIDAVLAAEAGSANHDDVRALRRLDPRSLVVLDGLTGAESVRAAATTLGMHHSTLQARLESLAAELGYNPRTSLGRTRYTVARMLMKLVSS